MRRRGKWNEEDREQFQEKLGMMEGGEGELQEEIETGMLKIRKTIEKREEGRMDNKNRRGCGADGGRGTGHEIDDKQIRGVPGHERANTDCEYKEDKNQEIQKSGREEEKVGVEIEGKDDRGG